MASQDPFPVNDQKALISANLNSTLMLLFLSGMYLAISPASIYIYISRTRTRAAKRTKYIIVGTLSALCLCLVLQIWIQWDYLNDVFIHQGESRLSSFIESVTSASFSVSIVVLQSVLQNVGFLLADGLMIWRCYHASGGSLSKISIPLVLFISEFGLTVADSTFIALFDLRQSLQTAENARRANHISAALFCTAAATSLSATLFLCYTIYSSTAMNPQSWKRYRYIVDIMLQSSAIYTTFAVILMISDFLNTGQAISSIKGLVLSNYIEPLAVVTSVSAFLHLYYDIQADAPFSRDLLQL
ncbi:hypothetical protein CPC08DRAFT_467512 [Agrocybe pediades]|nr:hypothetical protein CPC08DRAFT_467512 [Agrocybe pediades]